MITEDTPSKLRAIEALERLASQHIESARILHSLEWKYTYAQKHLSEAKAITNQIAEYLIQQNPSPTAP